MFDADFDVRDGAFSTDDVDALGVTSAAFMSAAAPRIRSKPSTPVGGYKASSLKQPLNGRLKGNRLKRRSITFAPNALTWSHDGTTGRQKLKNSCEEENGEDLDGMPSPVHSGRPTSTKQFSHLPAFLQPEAPVRANGSADAGDSSDSDGSQPDSSDDDDTFFTPTVNPTPTPALLANGTAKRNGTANSDDGNDSDRSNASLSMASQATNMETESENEKENIPKANGASANGKKDSGDAAGNGSDNDSDGSMIAGSGNDSDGSVVFGSDDGTNKSDEEVPEFAKRKPTVLPTARQRRLRSGILGASGANSPLAEAKKGLSQGLSQLPGNRRFQPRLSSWSKKRREMRGLRPPPSYSRLQARKAMEAPSPIRRSDVYNVPSPTNAQGEESNTPKEGPRVKRTLDLAEEATSPIVCSPAEAGSPASSTSSMNTVVVHSSASSPPAMNGAHALAVSSAELTVVRTEIDSLKKMTHTVIDKLDTLSATFDELRQLNFAGRLDEQAAALAELRRAVSSHAQSTNDRVTDLSTVVEALGESVSSSAKASPAAVSSSSPRGSRSPVRSGRQTGDSSSSSSSSSPSNSSSPPLELDSLRDSINELRSFTKESFERVHLQSQSQSPRSRSRASSSTSQQQQSNSSNRSSRRPSTKGRSKHAQHLARLARRSSAPGSGSGSGSGSGLRKGRPGGSGARERPVRPRVFGYGSIAFMIMLIGLLWYFYPVIAPLLQGGASPPVLLT